MAEEEGGRAGDAVDLAGKSLAVRCGLAERGNGAGDSAVGAEVESRAGELGNVDSSACSDGAGCPVSCAAPFVCAVSICASSEEEAGGATEEGEGCEESGAGVRG